MFGGCLPGVLVLIVKAYGKDDDLDVGVRECFFTNLEEVVGVGTGVAVQLDVGVRVAWDPVYVGVT